VMLTLLMRDYDWKTAKAMARAAIDGVGLEGKYKNLPAELSGGEQQRVSVARAVAGNQKFSLLMNPPLTSILFPEPKW